ncbi:MAG: hypothetical protein KGH71_04835 [Candidatus Micrarchaeota archaeon]|nr:hypothetical protein [Candidatus Micrarchaeota archaeon]
MIGTIGADGAIKIGSEVKSIGPKDASNLIFTDAGREITIAFKATFEDKGFNELLKLSKESGEGFLCLGGDKYYLTPKLYEKLSTPYHVLEGWTKKDTESVNLYLEKLKRGEIEAIKVPNPKELGPGGLKKWLLDEGKKIDANAVHPDEQKIADLVGKIRNPNSKKAKFRLLFDQGYVGWAPEERGWTEKDTQLIRETLAGEAKMPTEEEKRRAEEYNNNPNIVALSKIERANELIALIGEHAREEDINELHAIEDQFFERIKEQFDRGEISFMFIRPSEDLCDMLFGKGNYEFKLE